MPDTPPITSTSFVLANSFSGQKEVFVPQNPKRITIYVCGPTVYDLAHIGNARAVVVFDLLYRFLCHLYKEENIVYARNITDIDDKMIAAAQKENRTVEQIAETYKTAFHQDMDALYVRRPNLEPHATHHIAEMIALTGRLLARGHAYIAQGHILFDVTSYPAYGRLSKIDHEAMIAGARVEIAPYKKNPADFVLWKPSKEGEPAWDLPVDWGKRFGDMPAARPGWHLECSAMIEKSLLDTGGTSIDIHGGGLDLRFPHHENEIAQSCCAAAAINIEAPHTPLARYWLHNGFLQMGDDKMSKSLGNIITPNKLLQSWHGEVIRLALLSAQYRQPLEWTDPLLAQSKRQLDRFYRSLLETGDTEPAPCAPPHIFTDALKDDLNTPRAFSVLHQLREALISASPQTRSRAKGELLAAGSVLGLFNQEPDAYFKYVPGEGAQGVGTQYGESPLSRQEIDAMIATRKAAREARDFSKADEIRDTLARHNIIIEDRADGAVWRRG